MVRRNFRNKATETQRGVQAMDEAIGELSLKCDASDSRRALYLLSGPSKKISMDMVRDIGGHLKMIAPEAVIRGGDYPREKDLLEVTVILSELTDVAKIMSYFTKTIELISVAKKEEGKERGHRELDVDFKDIPSLL